MYNSYKPFRNLMRKYSRNEVLEAVYHYTQFLQFGVPVPQPFDHPTLHKQPKWNIGLFEWELETLAREAILSSPEVGAKKFSKWSDFATAINHEKRVENASYSGRGDEGDIFYELIRIAHRQFHWQAGIDQATLVRYLKLYSYTGLEEIILDEFKMLPVQMLQVAGALKGSLLQSMRITTPVRNHLNGIPDEIVALFIERFSISTTLLRSQLISLQSYDVNWAYTFNPMWLYPLLKVSDAEVICPLPTLLLYRATSGVYFDLVAREDFGNAFGRSFESYVGEVATAASLNNSFSILPERRYGLKGTRKDSVDWIVEDHSGTLFIECKSSRIRFEGKFDLANRAAMEDEVRRLAAFIVQTYKTLLHALDGQYEHWKPSHRPIYPLILTLDEWHAFGSRVEELIRTEVLSRLTEAGIEHSVLTDYPYQVCSIADFEMVAQAMAQQSIRTFMEDKLDGENALHPFRNFAVEWVRSHNVTLRQLFEGDMQRLLSEGIIRR